MTDLSRIDALKGLLERVQRNARSPRSLVRIAIDEPAPIVHLITIAMPDEPLDDAPRESLAFDLVPAPASTRASNGRNGFSDESTLSGSAEEVETLILNEQHEEAARKQIRFEETVHRAPTTRPPPTEAAPRRPVPEPEDDSPDILVLDELELGGPATEPPSALVVDPPPSFRTPSLPDVEAIEADLITSTESERTHHDLVPLDDEGAGEGDGEDDTPSSVRKPRDVDRGEDVHFDGFEPIARESEPPPESGEVPSQRRIAVPHDERSPSPDELYAQQDLETSGVVPALSREDELDARDDDLDDSDHEAFEEDDRAVDPLAMSTGARSEWGGESGEIDVESTKEIRALGRVDVVERTRIAQPPDIVVLKCEPRSTETFGEIFDEALSIGD